MNKNEKKALIALLTHPTVAEAATAAGLGHRTVARYLADPAFKTELSKRQDALVASVTSSLVGLAGKAIATLRDILEDKEASASVRARVALGWLAQMRQAVELADLAERIAKLEEVVRNDT